jgi:hypothetical protein
MKLVKQYNLRSFSVGITVGRALGDMMYVPSFMKIGSGIQVTLRLLPEQFKRVQCWYLVAGYWCLCVLYLFEN